MSKSVDLAEFNRRASRTRLRPDTRDAARRVLVDGMTCAEAGRIHNRTRQWASQAVQRIVRETESES